MTRINRTELFLGSAALFAQRSTCNRGHVGAVIVQDRTIVATGYNGAPPGMPHCSDVGCDVPEHRVRVKCERCRGTGENNQCDPCVVCGGQGSRWLVDESPGCQRAVHAEANAIAFASRQGSKLEGAHLYSTHAPCIGCARLIVSAGIIGVTYSKAYRLTEGIELLASVEIDAIHVPLGVAPQLEQFPSSEPFPTDDEDDSE